MYAIVMKTRMFGTEIIKDICRRKKKNIKFFKKKTIHT